MVSQLTHTTGLTLRKSPGLCQNGIFRNPALSGDPLGYLWESCNVLLLSHSWDSKHFSAKNVFLLPGAEVGFSSENKTNKVRREEEVFTSNNFIILTSGIYPLSSCLNSSKKRKCIIQILNFVIFEQKPPIVSSLVNGLKMIQCFVFRNIHNSFPSLKKYADDRVHMIVFEQYSFIP